MSASSFATRTVPARPPDGGPLGSWARRRSRLLAGCGALLAVSNLAVLETWRALVAGPVEWEALLDARRSPEVAIGFAVLGVVSAVAAGGALGRFQRLRRAFARPKGSTCAPIAPQREPEPHASARVAQEPTHR